MGHVITSEGLKADSGKIEGVIQMPKPQDVKEVRNYLAKFMPRLSAVIVALRQLSTSGYTNTTPPLKRLRVW